MRRVAARTGAKVTGITINEYQCGRARAHNAALNLQDLADVVRGDFHAMPLPDAAFDAAYAIEATCHSPDLTKVYGEVFRVLKPGGRFVTYEWVTTAKFDAGNPHHVKIIDEINRGNGLPEMRSPGQCEDAARKVGFRVVQSVDLATAATPPCVSWTERLRQGGVQHHINGAIVSTLSALRLLPAGVREAHDMLVDVADWLVQGGDTGTFSPMHMIVLEKPLGSA